MAILRYVEGIGFSQTGLLKVCCRKGAHEPIRRGMIVTGGPSVPELFLCSLRRAKNAWRGALHGKDQSIQHVQNRLHESFPISGRCGNKCLRRKWKAVLSMSWAQNLLGKPVSLAEMSPKASRLWQCSAEKSSGIVTRPIAHAIKPCRLARR